MTKMNTVKILTFLMISLLIQSISSINKITPLNKIKKCCPDGQVLDLHLKECTKSKTEPQDVSEYTVETVTVDRDSETINSANGSLAFPPPPTSPFFEETNLTCSPSSRYIFTSMFSLVRVWNGGREVVTDLLHKVSHNVSSQFCLDMGRDTRTGERGLVAMVCEESCSLPEKPCINFCCPPGQVSDKLEGGHCKQGNLSSPWLSRPHTPVYSPLHCQLNQKVEQGGWEVNMKGQVEAMGKVRDLSEYCVLLVANSSSNTLQLCPKEERPFELWKIVKLTSVTLSTVSIFLVILLHIIIPDLWKHHFTKLKVMFYCCLFISFLLLLTTSNLTPNFVYTHTTSCLCLGLTYQYFSLTLFFWLTSMSLDLWFTFSKLENPLQESEEREKRKETLRLRFHLFSFGCPLLVTLFTLTMQLLPDTGGFPHPGIGTESCFLAQYMVQFIYFYLLIIILLTINVVIYVLLVFKFTCGVWKTRMGVNNVINLRVFLDLLILMGISWLAEIVAFFVGWQVKSMWRHPALQVGSALNCLTGVFILLAFSCKQGNRDLVREFLRPSSSREDLAMKATVSTNIQFDNANNLLFDNNVKQE